MSSTTYKLIDNDHRELSWILETSPLSDERFFFEYNFQDLIKGWFSVVPKYLLKRQKIAYAALYYTRQEAEVRKVDGNFAVVELIWEPIAPLE
jgi:hypothetical protein